MKSKCTRVILKDCKHWNLVKYVQTFGDSAATSPQILFSTPILGTSAPFPFATSYMKYMSGSSDFCNNAQNLCEEWWLMSAKRFHLSISTTPSTASTGHFCTHILVLNLFISVPSTSIYICARYFWEKLLYS